MVYNDTHTVSDVGPQTRDPTSGGLRSTQDTRSRLSREALSTREIRNVPGQSPETPTTRPGTGRTGIYRTASSACTNR